MSENCCENLTLKGLSKTKRTVLTALLFAIALVLSLVEGALPPIPIAVPGIKLGLSNLAVMYALFFLGKGEAISIAVLKAGFVMLTRGAVAGMLSLSGGVLSVAVMAILIYIFKDRISYLVISIFGSVFHNIGQFAAISLLYTSMQLWAYLPVLLIAGVIAGVATSTLLRFILPALKGLA